MSAARIRSKHRRKKNSVRELPEEDPDFQIAPMIDVLLVLLVFFMSISSTEVLQSTKGIELPVATDASDKKKAKEVKINVSWNTAADAGGIIIDDRAFNAPEEIIPLLRERLAEVPETRVLVREDKATRWAFTRAVIAAASAAGIKNVTFSVVDKEGAKQQATTAGAQ
ncbi:MAG: biopolymer transporter ExbD [Verrucomicrobia bacterium]|nr:biopolymer transporter ExbD [Verrucomicrobiota bacterium]